MNKIELTTLVKAPIELCFDLCRSVDLHKISIEHTHEEAVGGVTKGLLGPNEIVLWKATHLGFRQTLETQISKYTRPFFFTDEMVSGIFKTMIHDHFFYSMNGDTVMIDNFYFESPLGLLGEAADFLFLKRYLTRLLEQRNETIKRYAESDKWREILLVSEDETSIVC